MTEKNKAEQNYMCEKILDIIGISGVVIFCPIWVPIVALMAVARIIIFAWDYYFGNN